MVKSLYDQEKETLDGYVELETAGFSNNALSSLQNAFKTSRNTVEDIAKILKVSEERVNAVFGDEVPINIALYSRYMIAMGKRPVFAFENAPNPKTIYNLETRQKKRSK